MKKVFSYIEQYQMIKPDDRVIVGLSGGADSVGLLLLLKEYRQNVKRNLRKKILFCLRQSMSIIRFEVKKQTGTKHLQKTCVSHLVFPVPVIPIRF